MTSGGSSVVSQASMQSASLISSQSINVSSSTQVNKSDSQLVSKKAQQSDDRLFRKLDKVALGKSLSLMERAIMSSIYEKSQFR